jgi:hypothetical protein
VHSRLQQSAASRQVAPVAPQAQLSLKQLPLQHWAFPKHGPIGTQQPPSRQVCCIPVQSAFELQPCATGDTQWPAWEWPVQQAAAELVGTPLGMQQTPASQTELAQQASEAQDEPGAAQSALVHPPLLLPPPRVDELWLAVLLNAALSVVVVASAPPLELSERSREDESPSESPPVEVPEVEA